MKRQPVYQCMRQGTKLWVIEKKGYLFDIIDHKGTPVTIALVSKGHYWTATHYESGLDCTPYSDKGGYEKRWRNKEELLEAVKNIDFAANSHNAAYYVNLVNQYKEASKR